MGDMVNKTSVVILTSHYRIMGMIDLMPGARLTDYVGEAKEFFAVVHAEVADRSTGTVLYTGKFMNINLRNIEVIFPADMIEGEK
ncbi:MAG: hypothetical protein KKB30_10765 [Proteobacteria bacterium]|nr:hypothetical protein [Pseudomonadota bacterium]MBU1717193.1 hypothetical protein [Pseudomonadota bacterium]